MGKTQNFGHKRFSSVVRLRLGCNAQDHHIDRCSMFDLCRPLLIGTSSGKKKKKNKKKTSH